MHSTRSARQNRENSLAVAKHGKSMEIRRGTAGHARPRRVASDRLRETRSDYTVKIGNDARHAYFAATDDDWVSRRNARRTLSKYVFIVNGLPTAAETFGWKPGKGRSLRPTHRNDEQPRSCAASPPPPRTRGRTRSRIERGNCCVFTSETKTVRLEKRLRISRVPRVFRRVEKTKLKLPPRRGLSFFFSGPYCYDGITTVR